jgi:hypothetical protein
MSLSPDRLISPFGLIGIAPIVLAESGPPILIEPARSRRAACPSGSQVG